MSMLSISGVTEGLGQKSVGVPENPVYGRTAFVFNVCGERSYMIRCDGSDTSVRVYKGYDAFTTFYKMIDVTKNA